MVAAPIVAISVSFCLFLLLFIFIIVTKQSFQLLFKHQVLYVFPIELVELILAIIFCSQMFERGDTNLAGATLFFIIFRTLYNFLCIGIVGFKMYYENFVWINQNKIGIFLLSIVSLWNVSILSFLNLPFIFKESPFSKEVFDSIMSLSLGNSYLSIPFIIICIISLTLELPPEIGVFLLILSLLHFSVEFIVEGCKWFFLDKVQSPRRLPSTSSNFELFPRTNSTNALETPEVLDSKPSWILTFFIFLFSPLVFITFILHFIFIYPSKLAILSLKRYFYFVQNKNGQVSPSKYSMDWYSNRGVFLFPVQFTFLIMFLIIFFIFILIFGAIIFLMSLLIKLFNPNSSAELRESFQDSYQRFITTLFWVYIPGWDQYPMILESQQKEKKISRWIVILSIVTFFIMEFALPILTSVFDVIYSFQLLSQSRDTFYEDEERTYLIGWTIVAFIVTFTKIAFHLFKYITYIIEFVRGEKKSKMLREFSLAAAGIGKVPKIKSIRFMKVLQAVVFLLGNIIQIAIKISTVRFIGQANPQWIITLVLSILSSSFKLGKYTAAYMYGRNFVDWVRKIIQGSLTIIFLLAFTFAVWQTTADTYCRLRKFIDEPNELEQIMQCKEIGFDLVFNEKNPFPSISLPSISFKKIQVNTHKLSSLNLDNIQGIGEEIKIDQNEYLVNITFGSLRRLNSSLTFSSLPSLERIDVSSLEIISGNLTFQGGNLETITFDSLIDLEGTLFISNMVFSQLFSTMTFSRLGRLGKIEIRNNTIETLDMRYLAKIEGTLTISNNEINGSIIMNILYSVPGYLSISNNKKLESIEMIRLSESSIFEIQGNPNLQAIYSTEYFNFERSIIQNNHPNCLFMIYDIYSRNVTSTRQC